MSEDPKAQVAELVKRLGAGGIIYVLDREFGKELTQHLQALDIKAEHFFRPRRKVLEAFEQGQLSVLVGLASSRSALVRGIDLPHVIRYVVFVGIPKFKFRVKLDEFSVPAFLSFLYNVRAVLPQDLRFKADRLIARLRRIAPYSARLDKVLREGASNSFEEYVLDVARSAVEFAADLLSRGDVRKGHRNLHGNKADLHRRSAIYTSARCHYIYTGKREDLAPLCRGPLERSQRDLGRRREGVERID
jgi:Reverse gyrase